MLNRFKSALKNVVSASELGLQYPENSDNGSDYINSNYGVEVEAKPYSRPSFLGLTAEETLVVNKQFFIPNYSSLNYLEPYDLQGQQLARLNEK